MKPHLIPYVAIIAKFFLLMQYNAGPYKAHLVDDFLEAETVQTMKSIGCSTDLIPIKNVLDTV